MADEASVSDKREVYVRLDGKPLHYTPRGARPLEPISLRIHYAVRPSGEVWHVWVRLAGYPPNESHGRPATRRNVGNDVDAMDGWIRELVAEHWPAWVPANGVPARRAG